MMYSHTSLPEGASTTGFRESVGTDPFLTEFRKQLTVYTNNYLEEYTNATERLGDLLKENPGLEPHWRTAGSRWRRQLVSPGVASIQSRYSDFFAAGRRRNTKRKRKKPQEEEEEELPIVLVPEEDPTECVTNTQLSSFGFLGFVLNVVNAVINVANNLNNNDNSNNNNDNNNNNNDLNSNQAEITETVSNTNTAAAAGRRIHRLKMMRDTIDANVRRIQTYKSRRRRSPSTCGREVDVVDEALLAAVALLDMWKELLFEEDPFCMALEVCQTAGKMAQASRLAGMIGQVGAVAAANMLLNFQGVNPEFLVAAAERGAAGEDCTSEYPACGEVFHRQ